MAYKLIAVVGSTNTATGISKLTNRPADAQGVVTLDATSKYVPVPQSALAAPAPASTELTDAQRDEVMALAYTNCDADPADSPAWSRSGMAFDAIDPASGGNYHYYCGDSTYVPGSGTVVVAPAWHCMEKLAVNTSPKPRLTTPTNLRVVGTPTADTIVWAWDAAPDADGYVLRAGTQAIYTGPNLTFAQMGLLPGTGHSVTVGATDSTNAYRPSPYSATVSATTQPATNQLVNWTPGGDSLTFGGQVGGPGSGNTYPEQATVLLNQAAGFQRVSISENMGIPSRSAHYWLTDTTTYNGVTPVAHAISLIQSGKINVATLKFGANDLVYGDSGTDPAQAFTPAQTLGYVQQVYTALKSGGYDYVFVDFVMNRTGFADFANFNTPRIAYNRLLLAATFPDGKIDLPSYPLVYGYNAPNNTTYFNDGSHLLIPGHAETAKAYAQCIARHIPGFTLAGGNGAEPVTAEDSTAAPMAAIAISPSTGTATQTRTITTSLQNAGTINSARLYSRTTPTGPGTAVGSPLTQAPYTFSVTPSSSTYYYVAVTPATGTVFNSQTVQAVVSTTPAPTFRTLDFTQHQINFTKQADGTLLKTSGSDDNHYAQATGEAYVPAGNGDDILVEFVMPPLGGGTGAGDVLIGFSSVAVPIDGSASAITTIDKVSFYLTDSKVGVFYVVNGSPTLKNFFTTRAAPGNRIQAAKRSDGYYFTNLTTNELYAFVVASGPSAEVPSSYLTSAHYISVVGSVTNESRVPVVNVAATQFSPI